MQSEPLTAAGAPRKPRLVSSWAGPPHCHIGKGWGVTSLNGCSAGYLSYRAPHGAGLPADRIRRRVDVWEELHPDEPGLTYDPKANPMLGGSPRLPARMLSRHASQLSYRICWRSMFRTQHLPSGARVLYWPHAACMHAPAPPVGCAARRAAREAPLPPC